MGSRVLVIDDEPLAVKNLAAKIQVCRPTWEVHTSTSPFEALELLRTETWDVLFLDIEMPGLTGFELLNNIEDYSSFKVVFVTAHASYATSAFDVAATDYLLKPVQTERLEEAIARCTTISQQQFTSRLEKIMCKKGRVECVIETTDIAYFASEQHETVGYLQDQSEVIVNISLSELETRLDPASFFRCHKSAIVNLHNIQTLDHDKNELILRTGHVLSYSRRRKKELLEKMQKILTSNGR